MQPLSRLLGHHATPSDIFLTRAAVFRCNGQKPRTQRRQCSFSDRPLPVCGASQVMNPSCSCTRTSAAMLLSPNTPLTLPLTTLRSMQADLHGSERGVQMAMLSHAAVTTTKAHMQCMRELQGVNLRINSAGPICRHRAGWECTRHLARCGQWPSQSPKRMGKAHPDPIRCPKETKQSDWSWPVQYTSTWHDLQQLLCQD